MRAELIAVGSEMVRTARRDTNSDWLSEQLSRIGIEVLARSVIEDEVGAIAAQIRLALARAELVLLTGGLGPTEDDRTRQAVAEALELPLVKDPKCVEKLRRLFETRRFKFRPMQERQAYRPRGATWLENTLGTAPGFSVELGDRLLAALPGVPCEMKAIFENLLLPRLRQSDLPALARSRLKVAGLTEPEVESMLADIYAAENLDLAILAGSAGIEVQLRAVAQDRQAAQELLEHHEQKLVRRLGSDLFGKDEESLPSVVGRLLEGARSTIATAESCTAGLLSAAITEVPGSSRWYRGGFIVYADDLKQTLVGVSAETLAAHGAVSEHVARELARGARSRCEADYGLGITGLAGPGGATPGKDVGLVHLALADAGGTDHWRMRFPGDRDQIRRRAVTSALDRLRRRLLASANDEC